LLLFADPISGSTLAINGGAVTIAGVQQKMDASRARFATGKQQ
jgi:hypothetical protein